MPKNPSPFTPFCLPFQKSPENIHGSGADHVKAQMTLAPLSNTHNHSQRFPSVTRRKVKLEYITNDASRRVAFKKSKKGLMKKPLRPSARSMAIFPSGRPAHVSRFKEMSDMEQSKKMVSHEAYLMQRIAKANKQLKKHGKDNRGREVTRDMFNALASTFTGTAPVWPSKRVMDLQDLGWVVDDYAKDVVKRSDSLKEVLGIGVGEVAAPPPLPPDVPLEGFAETENVGQVEADNGMQREQWFVDLGNRQEPNVPFAGNELMLLSFGGNINNNNSNNPQNVVWPNNNNKNPQNVV
ncbi:agamous-like MADS-box protein AGL80 [Rhodamnia argentea]|uniref:Agamous-like MADS-box protein AGL80 n=1 Tax=Rhodamnia argentea TaxID=178133 RepID=A0A8B8MYF0_9MYRT|nr:agamous-like MADS-box protein AGL80 [Rhodamnia argentea]